MTQTIKATFDGTVFRPTEPILLAPNTTVQLTVETLPNLTQKSASFLEVAGAQNLEGPPDWATNLDTYLYGEGTAHDQ